MISLVVTPLGGQQKYGVWKEVKIVTIKMSVGINGCREGSLIGPLSCPTSMCLWLAIQLSFLVLTGYHSIKV